MDCANCGRPNRDRANFCRFCGAHFALACPRCRAVLLDDSSFCDNCGLQLSKGAADLQPAFAAPPVERPSPAARAAPSAPPPLPSAPARPHLQQYIPKELMTKLDAARAGGEMVGERRIVTMLFCDVKGSTAAAGHMDPEEWSEVINGAFEHMITPVYHYEGTVARLMGDGILAFFGAPIAHEDDPQRAILAGLEIVEEIKEYRERVSRDWRLEIDVRVGINTGLVVVGAVGSDLRMEYTALGDAINLASRMEQTAKPGTVQIAHDTYKLVKPLFEFEELGGIEVKGKAEPVLAYRVLGRKAIAGRLRGIEGLHADLVGRKAELAALRGVIASLQHGVGGIVCVLGEAGLGKSRLIGDLKALTPVPSSGEGSGVRWHETASLSYESSQPYALFRRLIRRVHGITHNDSPAAVREKLAPLVESFAPERRPRVTQTLEALFGLESADGKPLEGEAFKRELFEAMREWWRARFADEPTALVFDDMHWSDAASVELLLSLLPLTEEISLVLLCALRPDRAAPGWQIKTAADADYHHRYTELRLPPLSEAESDELVNRLLTIADLPDRLRAGILEKSGGNPFFVEEVVRTLIDSGAVVAETRGDDPSGRLYWRATNAGAQFDIPDNLQSLLAARIDRLEEATRQTLQLASVIGRSFYRRVLTTIGSTGADGLEKVDEQLGQLVRLEMIREAARLPEVEYKFSNPLMQEAAYQTILVKRRREFHRRVGAAMETLFAGRLAELAPRLGHHFAEGGDPERALTYFALAGDTAYRLYANKEAVVHYDRALAIAVTVAEASPQLAHLFSRKGRALELNSQFADALANYERMEALAQARGDRPLELSALVLQGTIRSNLNDQNNPELAQALSGRALQLAQELGDEAAEAKIQWNLLNAHRVSTDLDGALAAGERALALSRKLNLREQLAYVANDLPYLYLTAGRPDRSRDILQEARGLWRELDNQPMLADSLSTSSFLHTFAGDFDAAIAFADEAFQISQSIHNLWGLSYSRYSVGDVYWERGDPQRAIETMETSIQYGRQAGFVVAEIWTQAHLALIYGLLGQPERGLELAQSALAQSEKYMSNFRPFALAVLARLRLLAGNLADATATVGEVEVNTQSPLVNLYLPLTAGTQARLALAQGDLAAADQVSDDVLGLLRQLGARQFLPEACCVRAQVFLAAGRIDSARETLRDGLAEADALGSRWWQWQLLAELSQIEAGRGEAAEAENLRRQAREIVEYVAAHCPADLRESFLALPEVRQVMGGRPT